MAMRPNKKTSFRLLTLSSVVALLSPSQARPEPSRSDQLSVFSPPAIVTLTNAEKALAFPHFDYFAPPLENSALISQLQTPLAINTSEKAYSDYAWSLL
ncbi:MAG: hypothetical protein EBT10_05155, partial [Methylocystaceae bacterium]|nr:hypothetical protein [Methylocystaceae bacterium]